jgi:hypothetical protein
MRSATLSSVLATLNGATYMGREKEIGSVAVGKNADLVVIKGDPSKQISDIENVEIVFKDGVGYDSQKLLHSVSGRYGQYRASSSLPGSLKHNLPPRFSRYRLTKPHSRLLTACFGTPNMAAQSFDLPMNRPDHLALAYRQARSKGNCFWTTAAWPPFPSDLLKRNSHLARLIMGWMHSHPKNQKTRLTATQPQREFRLHGNSRDQENRHTMLLVARKVRSVPAGSRRKGNQNLFRRSFKRVARLNRVASAKKRLRVFRLAGSTAQLLL